jgi:hypothetical protein
MRWSVGAREKVENRSFRKTFSRLAQNEVLANKKAKPIKPTSAASIFTFFSPYSWSLLRLLFMVSYLEDIISGFSTRKTSPHSLSFLLAFPAGLPPHFPVQQERRDKADGHQAVRPGCQCQHHKNLSKSQGAANGELGDGDWWEELQNLADISRRVRAAQRSDAVPPKRTVRNFSKTLIRKSNLQVVW